MSRKPIRNATAADVRGAFAITDRTLRRWIAKGLPVDRGRPGLPHGYDLEEVAAWVKARGLTDAPVNTTAMATGGTQEQAGEMAELKLRKLRSEARKLGLAVAKIEGALVEREGVTRANVERAIAFRTQLLSLPARLGADLVALEDQVDVEGALRDALEEVLEDLAARPVVVVDGGAA